MVNYSAGNSYITAHGETLILPALNEAQWQVVASAYSKFRQGQSCDDFLEWCSSLPVLRSIGIPVTEDGDCEDSDLEASPLHSFLYDIHHRLSVRQGYAGCVSCCLDPVERKRAENTDFSGNKKVLEELLRT